MEDLYPYDHVLYHPSKICSTCHVYSIPFSKSDSTLNRPVRSTVPLVIAVYIVLIIIACGFTMILDC